MKKILIYLLSFILICFVIPAILTKRTVNTISQENTNIENQQSQQDKENEQNYQYSKYGTITLLHKKTGNTEQVNIDDYLCNVVSAEMPADFEI